MSSKEKAIELFNRFHHDELLHWELSIPHSKQCALIAVDELLNHCYEVMKPFWEEVKLEIEKL